MNSNSEKPDYSEYDRRTPENSEISLPGAVLMTFLIALITVIPFLASNIISILFLVPQIIASATLAFLLTRLKKPGRAVIWTAVSALLSYAFSCFGCTAVIRFSLPSFMRAEAVESSGLIFIYALFSLMYIVPGVVLFIAVKHKASRASATVSLTAALTAVTLIILLVTAVNEFGTLSLGVIKDGLFAMINTELEPLKQGLLELKVATENGEVHLYTEESVNALINSIILLLPSAAVVMLTVIAYLITVSFSYNVRMGGISYVLPSPWQLNMSIVSAYIFVITFFLGFVSGAQNYVSPVWLVSQILYCLLLPGFTLVGFRTAFKRKPGADKKSYILPTLIILSFFIIPMFSVYFISAVGTANVFITHYREKAAKKKADKENE